MNPFRTASDFPFFVEPVASVDEGAAVAAQAAPPSLPPAPAAHWWQRLHRRRQGGAVDAGGPLGSRAGAHRMRGRDDTP